MHICENIDITFILSACNTLISSDPHDNVSFAFIAQDEMTLGIPRLPLRTVPQQFIFLPDRLSNRAGDEK